MILFCIARPHTAVSLEHHCLNQSDKRKDKQGGGLLKEKNTKEQNAKTTNGDVEVGGRLLQKTWDPLSSIWKAVMQNKSCSSLPWRAGRGGKGGKCPQLQWAHSPARLSCWPAEDVTGIPHGKKPGLGSLWCFLIPRTYRYPSAFGCAVLVLNRHLFFSILIKTL